jgi:hypothetical protein
MFRSFLIFVILWTVPWAAFATPVQATLNVGGVSRDYIIDIPAGARPKPANFLLRTTPTRIPTTSM